MTTLYCSNTRQSHMINELTPRSPLFNCRPQSRNKSQDGSQHVATSSDLWDEKLTARHCFCHHPTKHMKTTDPHPMTKGHTDIIPMKEPSQHLTQHSPDYRSHTILEHTLFHSPTATDTTSEKKQNRTQIGKQNRPPSSYINLQT